MNNDITFSRQNEHYRSLPDQPWNQRRSENVRYVNEEHINIDHKQTISDGITFNRRIDVSDEQNQKQRETRVKEIEESNRRQHSVYATFIDGFPENCEESTGYGIINGIASKIIRDSLEHQL